MEAVAVGLEVDLHLAVDGEARPALAVRSEVRQLAVGREGLQEFECCGHVRP